MGQTTEEIEAKLAAYVDGVLDDAGRAEIEKHLASHPQHRELLADLSTHRDLLRKLPSEKAPPEILDAIQAHLERRLLLEEHNDVAGRIGPSTWSRIMSIAAVLVLAATLGLVIYSVVPSSRTASDEFAAVDSDRSAVDAREAGPVAAATPARGLEEPPVRIGGETTGVRSDATPLAERIATAAADALEPRDILAAGGGRISDFDPVEVAAGAASSAGVPGPARISLDREVAASAGSASVLLLFADDPESAERELSSVLNDNGVAFQQMASASPPVAMIAPAADAEFARRSAPSTAPSEVGRILAGAELRDQTDQASRIVADSALANAGPRSQDGQYDSVFFAPKISRAQYQAINDAMSRIPRARQQLMPPDEQQQQQIVAEVQSRVMNEAFGKDKADDENKSKLSVAQRSEASAAQEQSQSAPGGLLGDKKEDEFVKQLGKPSGGSDDPLTDVYIVVRNSVSEGAEESRAIQPAPTTAPVVPATAPSTQPNP